MVPKNCISELAHIERKPFFTGILGSAAYKISKIWSGEVFLDFFFYIFVYIPMKKDIS